MFSRREWLRIWIALTVIWTLVVVTLGWFNLPRAQHVRHNPDFINRLSDEAALILTGNESKAKPSMWGEPIWSNAPISVPMPNGTRLTFPSTTTSDGVALVTNEYYKLLKAEADAELGQYLLRITFAWLLPCPILLVLGLAAELIGCAYQAAVRNGAPESAAAGWIRARRIALPCPLRIANSPGYDANWRWRMAGRNAEPGF